MQFYPFTYETNYVSCSLMSTTEEFFKINYINLAETLLIF